MTYGEKAHDIKCFPLDCTDLLNGAKSRKPAEARKRSGIALEDGPPAKRRLARPPQRPNGGSDGCNQGSHSHHETYLAFFFLGPVLGMILNIRGRAKPTLIP